MLYYLCLLSTIWINNTVHFVLQLVLERDNKDSNIKLQLKIRGGRDNVAKSDITKTASYGPSFFKNQQSS